jgi:hypothetical protein
MAEKMSLDLNQLEVVSFATYTTTSDAERQIPAGDSWPAVCTCIGICEGTKDLYCSGGCPPVYAAPMEMQKKAF